MDSRELYHIGVKRRSGRYPWGSGERPYQSGGGPSGGKRFGLPNITVKKKKKLDKEPEPVKKKNKPDKEPEPVKKENKPNNSKSSSSSGQKKSVKDMTDDELRTAINRIRLEQEYVRLFPKKESAGKRAVKAVWDRVLLPTMVDVGKQYLKKKMLEGLGLKEVKITNKGANEKEETKSELIGIGTGKKKKKKNK